MTRNPKVKVRRDISFKSSQLPDVVPVTQQELDDERIRAYAIKTLNRRAYAGISEIAIVHGPDRVELSIYTVKPNVFAGRRHRKLDQLSEGIRRLLNNVKQVIPIKVVPVIESWNLNLSHTSLSHGVLVHVVNPQKSKKLDNHDSTRLRSLLRGLSSNNPNIRLMSVNALGQLGNENVIPALCDILATDPSSDVRSGAAKALGVIGSKETDF